MILFWRTLTFHPTCPPSQDHDASSVALLAQQPLFSPTVSSAWSQMSSEFRGHNMMCSKSCEELPSRLRAASQTLQDELQIQQFAWNICSELKVNLKHTFNGISGFHSFIFPLNIIHYSARASKQTPRWLWKQSARPGISCAGREGSHRFPGWDEPWQKQALNQGSSCYIIPNDPHNDLMYFSDWQWLLFAVFRKSQPPLFILLFKSIECSLYLSVSFSRNPSLPLFFPSSRDLNVDYNS